MSDDKIRGLAAKTIDELIAAVESGQSDRLRDYLAQLARFHRYSITNLFLIMAQNPQASRVAGYRTWQSMGRQVCRGSKAIKIFAPIVRKRSVVEMEDEEALAGFRTVNVFDIGQTEGQPLIGLACVGGDPGKHIERLKAFVASRGIRLQQSDSLGGADGVSRGGAIVLRCGLPPADQFSVLTHELAHELLHREGQKLSRTVQETEAEAVAFVVCHAVGLEAEAAASDYIQLYRGDKKMLLESLERIQRTANTVLRAVLPDEHHAAAKG